MNKYIVGAIVIVVLGVGLGAAINTGVFSSGEQVASAVVVTEDSYDFGDIDIFGGKVETKYTLKNTGTEDVKIISAVTSCMCTEGKIGRMTFGMHQSIGGSEIIPAGGEKVLTAIFDPLAHGPEGTGPITRELFLTTNSSETPEVEVKFKGNVIKNEGE